MYAVAVVIVTWNGLALTRRVLASLREQATSAAVQTIVIDNGSTDGTIAMLRREFPAVTVHRFETNQGFARANNAAMDFVEAPLVFLLNNDTVLLPGSLQAFLDAAAASPGFDIFAADMLQLHAPHLVDNRGIYLDPTGHCRQLDSNAPAEPSPGVREVFGPSGGACVIRRRVIDEIGLFDESLESYLEDGDFALRARAAGYRCLFVPAARVLHEGSATGDRMADRKLYLIQRNMSILRTRWFPLSARSPVSWLSAARDLYYVLRAIPSGRGALVLRAKRDARRAAPVPAQRDRDTLQRWVGIRARPAVGAGALIEAVP